MMAAVSIMLCDAIKNALNADAPTRFGRVMNAQRSILPMKELKALKTNAITVNPADLAPDFIARARAENTFTAHIAIRQVVNAATVETEVPPLLELVEKIITHFQTRDNRNLALDSGAIAGITEISVNPLYDHGYLRRMGLFFSAIEVKAKVG